ncbi:hypothetical protein MHC_03525 [Mycoplasma haemocanis str. Illinois]|uniref:Uncharacterized protein n=1 Tax=Mycoplasma haemocanis (strain Illinois) TaxID=1111676 RepID=H6N7E3_MYCHN|nr:hypothetical protein [Mycoplasma haemocanis]AEW45565.1 hypothetical protein MHC_03525 [Mycoplasma haemocanis str. Illinois]
MNSTKLGFALLGGTGVAGTTAVGVYRFKVFSSKSSTIGDLLEKEKYQLLKEKDSDHQKHWKESSDKYKEKYTDKSSYNEDKMKELCRDLLGKEETHKSEYDQAKKYCVVPRKISERLKDLGLTQLSTTGSESGVTDKWKKLSTEYKTKGEGDKKLSDLDKSTINDDTSTGDSLKNKCKTVFDKGHWETDYDSLLENAKRWCTDEGFNQLPTSGNQ